VPVFVLTHEIPDDPPDNLPPEHTELELVRVMTTPDKTDPAQQVLHLRYQIRRP
jgi:hypothetical protein